MPELAFPVSRRQHSRDLEISRSRSEGRDLAISQSRIAGFGEFCSVFLRRFDSSRRLLIVLGYR